MFICNHCPFVKILKEGIKSLTDEYRSKGVASVAISSNSVKTHPQDGPEQMAEDASSFGTRSTNVIEHYCDCKSIFAVSFSATIAWEHYTTYMLRSLEVYVIGVNNARSCNC
jgi:hypothetical protein